MQGGGAGSSPEEASCGWEERGPPLALLRRSGTLLLRCPSAAALQAGKVWTPTRWTRMTAAMSGISVLAI